MLAVSTCLLFRKILNIISYILHPPTYTLVFQVVSFLQLSFIILDAFIISHMHSAYTAHLIVLDLITLSFIRVILRLYGMFCLPYKHPIPTGFSRYSAL
jgi:hypothetical protein